MKNFSNLFLALFLFSCISISAQAPVFDDLVFEDDSITSTYRASSKHFVYAKAKKGTGGMEKISSLDSIRSFEVTDIVLVFSETTAASIANRYDNNKERWENLLSTYPELFQFNTNYKNLCQCNTGGDAELFKKMNGFYVYYKGGPEPKKETPVAVVEKKVEEKKAEEPKKIEEKKTEQKKNEEKKEEKKEEKVVKEETKKEEKKKEEKVVKEEKKVEKQEEKKEEATATVVPDEVLGEEPETNTNTVKPTSRQKAKFTSPKRSKDKKACRPPCYENGDEDLINYFVNAIEITKKEKKKAKKWTSTVTLILNFDGTVKKFMVTGPDEVFNKRVNGAVGAMNAWNPAVKSGVTIKSQVKFNLKFDKSKKGMIPTEINFTPRPGPKCVCVPDSELFD